LSCSCLIQANITLRELTLLFYSRHFFISIPVTAAGIETGTRKSGLIVRVTKLEAQNVHTFFFLPSNLWLTPWNSCFKKLLSYPTISYPILSYPIQSYPILSYPILTYPALSYHILSYPAISYHILSYLILPYPTISDHTLSYPTISDPILPYPILSYHTLPTLSKYFKWSRPFRFPTNAVYAFRISPMYPLHAAQIWTSFAWCPNDIPADKEAVVLDYSTSRKRQTNTQQFHSNFKHTLAFRLRRIYLFTYLFIHSFIYILTTLCSVTEEHIPSNERLSKWRLGKDVEGSGRGLVKGATPELAWRDSGESQKPRLW
jgi:hypothetical protein